MSQSYPPRPEHPARPTGPNALPIFLFILALVVAVLVLPYLVEAIEFAVTRGRERAQAEVAKQQLASLPATESRYTIVAKAIEPSVVGVVTTQGAQRVDEWSHLFGLGPQLQAQSLGSGVIVDSSGYIVTNYHVVANAESIVVKLSEGRAIEEVTLVGEDPASDLAVLKIDTRGLVAAKWGDSDKLEVGEQVLAVGSPFGLARTVTAGIISAKGRRGVAQGSAYQDFLQTDAAVNPGNSGGPLVNMRGEVVGINTAIASHSGGYEGISFALPSNLAKDVYERLRTTGRVERGWLGVELQDIDRRLAGRLGLKEARGALVANVLRDSPAEKAGIQPGDVIVQWNGKPVESRDDLPLLVARSEIGQNVKVVLVRDGQRLELTVKVGRLKTR
jgi:serine protease Do